MARREHSDTQAGRDRWARRVDGDVPPIRYPNVGRVTSHGVADVNMTQYIASRRAVRVDDEFIVEPIPVRVIGRDNAALEHVAGDVVTEPSAAGTLAQVTTSATAAGFIKTATEGSNTKLGTIDVDTGFIKTATEGSNTKLGTIDADTGLIKTATETSATKTTAMDTKLGTIDADTGFIKTATEAVAVDVDLSKRSAAAMVPSFHPYSEVPDILARDKWVLFTATGTCDGGGNLAAVTLVPALGGYTGVVRLFTVSGDANISGGLLTLAPTGGALTSSPASVSPVGATGANIEHEWRHGWYGHGDYGGGTDDNKVLGMTGAGLGAGSVIYVQGEYQYVT